jgi:hypothetical protein
MTTNKDQIISFNDLRYGQPFMMSGSSSKTIYIKTHTDLEFINFSIDGLMGETLSLNDEEEGNTLMCKPIKIGVPGWF